MLDLTRSRSISSTTDYLALHRTWQIALHGNFLPTQTDLGHHDLLLTRNRFGQVHEMGVTAK